MAKAIERHLHRAFASRGFRAVGFDTAPPAMEALREFKDRGEPVAVVIADQHAREMAGLDLLREGRKLHPEARTVLLCGHADFKLAVDAINAVALDHFLVKPFDGERDLLPIVSDLLDGWQGARDRDAAGVRIVGERDSSGGHMIRQFLAGNNIHYQWLEPDLDEGKTLLAEIAEPDRGQLPVVVFPDGVAVAQPSNVELASQLGIATRPTLDHYDVVIVGGGPAGLAAAVYASSEGLSTVIIEREAPGGQAGQSPRIDNYLGFHAGLSGSELTRRAIIQARRFGAEIVRPREVVGIDWRGDDRILHLSDHTTVRARSVLISTGVSYRRLTAPGVSELIGAGVYYGASAGDAQDRRDQHVVIVGGANSAGQWALNFARYARQVTMLIRADSLAKGMSQYLIDQIESAGNIEVLTRAQLAAAHGSDRLESLTLKRDGAGTGDRVPAEAVFIFIGALPHTDWLQGKLICDDGGFIVSGRDLGGRPADWPLDRDPYLLESCMPGVFVAGDVRHGSNQRVASAVGEGSMAVRLIHQYLAERE